MQNITLNTIRDDNIIYKIMFKACKNASKMLFNSYQETALISGISDIIVVQWSTSKYKTTPFLVCFGSMAHQAKKEEIQVYINKKQVKEVQFYVNKFGYLEPFHPSSVTISKLQLQHGKNTIQFKTSWVTLEADIFLYNLTDKLIISDMDGTMTKTDLMGLVSNYREQHYLHDGYDIFIKELANQGYKIIWITMRSIALYAFSKKYINKYVQCEGALLPQPEEFFPSVKKQIMKKTGNIKTNMIRMIRQLFPPQINPFAGGLGNRQNDAIAYLAMGIPSQKIYLVSEQSQIMTLAKVILKNYVQLHQQIETHFPPTPDKIAERNQKRLAQSEECRTQQKDMKNNLQSSKMKRFFEDLKQQNSANS